MSAVLIDVSRLSAAPQRVKESIRVGKDILDLLAGAMYTDPLNVYREYVQNAADSIDLARASGISFEPVVEISFDHDNRSVRIRDNGLSIPAESFVTRLVTFGASEKRGKNLRGFRGVGRLAGLGFCQQLIFRGRSERSAKVIEVEWDGRVLKRLVKDPAFEGGLQDLVHEVVTTREISGASFPDRFFEVEMQKVLRAKNDLLLNEDAVGHYLAQVAPVPDHPAFPYKSELARLFEKYGIPPPLKIQLGSSGNVLHRLVSARLPGSETSTNLINGFEQFEIEGVDGEVCAVGWVANHSYVGGFTKASGVGGLRLRCGNIQVGDNDLTANLFPESRFGSWTVGEIHVISPKILPNGRRDDFEPSVHYTHLQTAIAIRGKAITQQIRDQSIRRNRIRTVRAEMQKVEEWVEQINAPSMPKLVVVAVQNLARDRLEKVTFELEKLDMPREAKEIQKSLKTLSGQVEALSGRGARKNTRKTVTSGLEQPIVAAITAILQSARSSKDGVAMATSVLKAFESALA